MKDVHLGRSDFFLMMVGGVMSSRSESLSEESACGTSGTPGIPFITYPCSEARCGADATVGLVELCASMMSRLSGNFLKVMFSAFVN